MHDYLVWPFRTNSKEVCPQALKYFKRPSKPDYINLLPTAEMGSFTVKSRKYVFPNQTKPNTVNFKKPTRFGLKDISTKETTPLEKKKAGRSGGGGGQGGEREGESFKTLESTTLDSAYSKPVSLGNNQSSTKITVSLRL